MSYNWAVYADPTSCTPRLPGGAKSLAAYLEDRFPYQTSLGICNCRPVRGGSTLSHHGPCWAYDCGFPTGPGGSFLPEYGDPIVELLGPHGRRLGLDHLIMNRIIYSARSPNGRVYRGRHPHYNHAHIGLSEEGARHLNYATLVAVLGDPAAGGDDMSLLGYDIGKIGDPSVKGLRSGALQAYLVDLGYDLGEWGPNGDGVDESAGDDTRRALHDWKVAAGITPAKSAGEGKIGSYEWAEMHSGGETLHHDDYAKKDHKHIHDHGLDTRTGKGG